MLENVCYNFSYVCSVCMQCHNYISDVYNKPNRLKIGRKMSKLWLFKSTCTIEVVSEYTVARWPPRADVDLHWPAVRTRHLAFIYDIYAVAYSFRRCVIVPPALQQ